MVGGNNHADLDDCDREWKRAAPAESPLVFSAVIDRSMAAAHSHERLIDLIIRVDLKLSQVCDHHQLGPIRISVVAAY